MSGYLHRLVRTVSHPRQTVHPRTGSLFAPYRSQADSPSELFGQVETVAAHPARSAFSATGAPAETARDLARSDDSQSPLLPGTANEPSRVSESARRADLSRPRSNEAQHDTPEHAVETPRRLAAPQAQRAESDSGHYAVQVYVPLIQPRQSEANSATPETPQISKEASSTKEARTHSPAEGRSARAESRPDEIQIHIGRIEVTAVQPPAPRASKAPDIGISLDAYLERRNGRLR